MRPFIFLPILSICFCLFCACKSVQDAPVSMEETQFAQYGSALVQVSFASYQEWMKVLASGGRMELLVRSSANDTLYWKTWYFPDTLPSPLHVGPIAAWNGVVFSLSIFDASDTLTHFGADTADITAGSTVQVNLEALSRFGSIRLVLQLPKELSGVVVQGEMIVEADRLSPRVADLVFANDTACAEVDKIPAGKDRIITLRLYDGSRRLLYLGRDTVDLDPGRVQAVYVELALVGGNADITASIGENGVIEAQAIFPGQKIADEMVLIPAGPFLMGPDTDERQVQTDSFWIDAYEVTNRRFAEFLSAATANLEFYDDSMKIDTSAGKAVPRSVFADHPVTFVSWDESDAYCKWKGMQLPSDTMWEKAARGTDGRTYPWGDEAPDTSRLNFRGDFGGTTTVGRFETGKSPYGLYDMAGNVYEWCSTRDYSDTSTIKYVRKSNGWRSTSTFCKSSYRGKDSPSQRNDALGFRCAKSLK